MRFLTALLAALLAAPLAADELRPAVVELAERESGQFVLEYRLPVAASRSESVPLARPVVPETCRETAEPVRRAEPLALIGRVELACEAPLAGQKFGLDALTGNADAIARFLPLDRPAQSFRLTAAAPTAAILAEPDRAQVLADYFVIGAEHILFGWDHLLFVVALVLLVRDARRIAWAATAFTLGHSATLVATTLGHAGLPSRPVEALIALSIVFLAVEVAIVLRDPERRSLTRRLPWLVALGFGLVHGFGFAGALAEIGLPPGESVPALFAFNIGVEAGQLVIVGALLGLLAILARAAPRAEPGAMRLAAYAIGTIGSFWLIERVVG
ncbi:MAG: HupE/UreJ family protein [Erythrobacter sp.]|nr:MAG: HupE/UreJ family protein [Erythrobacter sp.]